MTRLPLTAQGGHATKRYSIISSRRGGSVTRRARCTELDSLASGAAPSDSLPLAFILCLVFVPCAHIYLLAKDYLWPKRFRELQEYRDVIPSKFIGRPVEEKWSCLYFCGLLSGPRWWAPRPSLGMCPVRYR